MGQVESVKLKGASESNKGRLWQCWNKDLKQWYHLTSGCTQRRWCGQGKRIYSNLGHRRRITQQESVQKETWLVFCRW